MTSPGAIDETLSSEILGLFPDLAGSGGIAASGHIAWQGIVARAETFHKPRLLCFGSVSEDLKKDDRAEVVERLSKAGAIATALRRRSFVRRVLVWHLGLLKLLPLLRLPKRTEVFLFLHGIEAWRVPTSLTARYLRRVRLILTNSDYTWERFVTVNPGFGDIAHRTVHLGLGESLSVTPKGPDETPIAVIIGRVFRAENYKGHREMIAAWPLVIERIPRAELWVLGDGDLRSDLQKSARALGLEAHVRFVGWRPEQEKQDILTKARCLAMPSRAEGFGLVYLEAMRIGRPCLVSTVDAGREVVNPPDAGLAVDPADPHAMSDAICRLLTVGPEWRRWSERARTAYEERFTARSFQDRLVAALLSAGR